MAEAVGLALGVAALYSACVDIFDVVVSARDFSREYEELSALVRGLDFLEVAHSLLIKGLCLAWSAAITIRTMGRVCWSAIWAIRP